MSKINERVEREKQFHDVRYSDESIRRQKVSKFYSITDSITKAYQQKLLDSSKNSKVIEYGCGKGSCAFKLAKNQAKLVTGIDISPVAIEAAKQQAVAENIDGNIEFKLMNAEHLEFGEGSYDLICGSGILHHLDLDLATNSIVKTLKPNGKAVFLEPLGHNFLINLYRRLTPTIRTEDEHPLLEKDLQTISRSFKQAQIRYFYLTSLAACFVAGKPGFKTLLRCCELIDSIVLKVPGIRQQAWLVVIELSQPIKLNNSSV